MSEGNGRTARQKAFWGAAASLVVMGIAWMASYAAEGVAAELALHDTVGQLEPRVDTLEAVLQAHLALEQERDRKATEHLEEIIRLLQAEDEALPRKRRGRGGSR